MSTKEINNVIEHFEILDGDEPETRQANLQRELREAMSGSCGTPLSTKLAQEYDARALRRIGLALDQAQESLNTQIPVNPAMVLDWVATRLA